MGNALCILTTTVWNRLVIMVTPLIVMLINHIIAEE